MNFDPILLKHADNVAPVSMRLAHETDVVLHGQIEFAIEQVIAAPLALDGVRIRQADVLWNGAFGRRHNPIEARSPLPRIVVETPMVVAKPVQGDGIRFFGYPPHDRLIELVREKHREHDIGLPGFCGFQQTAVHGFFAKLLEQAQRVEVNDAVAASLEKVIEVVMFEAIALLRLAVIVLWRDVQNPHRSAHHTL